MTTDAVGGVWDYSLELARGLSRHGVAIDLATMGPPPTGPQKALAIGIPGLALLESRFRLEWMADPETDLVRAGDWLLGLARQRRPDIIHLNGYAHAALPWPAPVLVVAHSCVLSWWQAVHRAPAPPEWAPYATRVARGLAAADLVVAPTRAMLTSLAALYGPMRRSRVIANGRDPRQWRPLPKDPIIFSAGRLWDPAKNVGALEAVAGRLDWPVVVAGDWRRPEGGGTPPRSLTALGVITPERMHLGLGKAAVFALPARYEPFGLAVLEAALCEAVLVLGDIPTLRELWRGAALFVRPDDHAALRRALSALAASPRLRRRLGHAARLRAQSYTTRRMVAAYLDVYRELRAVPDQRSFMPPSVPGWLGHGATSRPAFLGPSG